MVKKMIKKISVLLAVIVGVSSVATTNAMAYENYDENESLCIEQTQEAETVVEDYVAEDSAEEDIAAETDAEELDTFLGATQWIDIKDTALQYKIENTILTLRVNPSAPSDTPDYQRRTPYYDEENLYERPWNSMASKITGVVAEDGVFGINGNAFRQMPNLESVVTGNGLYEIYDYAFCCCPKLKSVVLGRDFNLFGQAAFAGCVSLNQIEFKSKYAPTFGSGAFSEYPLAVATNYLPKEGIIYVAADMPAENIESIRNTFETNLHDGVRAVTGTKPISGKWVVIQRKAEPTPTPSPKPTPTKKFSDVNYNSWMGKPIETVIQKGYMNGVSATEFKPMDSCTREMMVQILYNINKSPAVSGTCTFTDVIPGKWYYNAIVWGQKAGVANGSSPEHFGVGGQVTRQELAQFLYNYAKQFGLDTSKSADISGFADAGEVSGWAVPAMKWAYGSKVVNGANSNGTLLLKPKATATRAEVAAMICNLMSSNGR